MADDDVAADVEDQEPKERIQLSLAQVAASSAAAVSAAVVCSFFGVAGTVIGTAITSLVATIGSALYVHSLRRTKARLRRLHQAGAASPPLTEVWKTTRQQGREWLSQVPWRAFAVGAVAVFVFSTALITVVEASAGRSLSSLFGVSHSGSRSTALGSLFHAGPKSHHHKAKPKPTPSTSPSPSSTPTPTVTVTVTPTPTPSLSPTVTPTLTPPSLLPSLGSTSASTRSH